MYISQISPQKYGSAHFDPLNRKKNRNHSDQSEHVLRIFKLYYCLFQKNETSFPNFFFGL